MRMTPFLGKISMIWKHLLYSICTEKTPGKRTQEIKIGPHGSHVCSEFFYLQNDGLHLHNSG